MKTPTLYNYSKKKLSPLSVESEEKLIEYTAGLFSRMVCALLFIYTCRWLCCSQLQEYLYVDCMRLSYLRFGESYPNMLVRDRNNNAKIDFQLMFTHHIFMSPAPPGGWEGYSGFKVTGMIEWSQKWRSKKIPRASSKTPQKIPGPNINPKKSHPWTMQAIV